MLDEEGQEVAGLPAVASFGGVVRAQRYSTEDALKGTVSL